MVQTAKDPTPARGTKGRVSMSARPAEAETTPPHLTTEGRAFLSVGKSPAADAVASKGGQPLSEKNVPMMQITAKIPKELRRWLNRAATEKEDTNKELPRQKDIIRIALFEHLKKDFPHKMPEDFSEDLIFKLVD